MNGQIYFCSYVIWMSHVTHPFTPFTSQSCEWVTHPESWHTCEWATAHIWISHVTHPFAPFPSQSFYWVMAHTWISHGTRMKLLNCVLPLNESWHTCQWVISHMWISHVTSTSFLHVPITSSLRTPSVLSLSHTYTHTHISLTHTHIHTHAHPTPQPSLSNRHPTTWDLGV